MAQNKQLTWTELRVGLFVLAGVILLIVVIFYVTGAGGGLGPKYRLRVFLPEVDGLTVGAPVRVDGVDVGNVEKIIIARTTPGQSGKNRNIELDLRVQKSYQDYIRTDSSAGLVTEGLLGNRYVDIDRGFVGQVLKNEEEIPSREEKDLKEVVARGADMMESLSKISQEASDVLTDIRSGKGSLGKFMVDEDAYNHLDRSLGNLDAMLADVSAGKGTLGKLIVSDEMYDHANSATGHLDNILEAVQTQKGSLGKLVYDPEVHDSLRKFLDNGNSVMGDVRAGKGTLGKLATDDSLFTKYREVGENLSSATAKMNSMDGTVGKFFTDPKFYDNVSGLAADSRLLIGDFRKNPKKFLHVKFSIF